LILDQRWCKRPLELWFQLSLPVSGFGRKSEKVAYLDVFLTKL